MHLMVAVDNFPPPTEDLPLFVAGGVTFLTFPIAADGAGGGCGSVGTNTVVVTDGWTEFCIACGCMGNLERWGGLA